MKQMRVRSLMLGLAVLAVVALLWLWWSPAPQPEAPQATGPVETALPAAIQEVTLYFAAHDEPLLAAETRELPACADEPECLARVLEAWLAGSQRGLAAVVPEGTRLNSVTVEEGTAWVDLSEELVRRHPGGSQAELLTVTALANTLAVNFPHVRQVRLRVAGDEPATLKGHVLLGQPIPADFRFLRATPAEEGPKGGGHG